MLSQFKSPITTAVRLSLWLVFLWWVGKLILDGLFRMFQINWAGSGWGDCRVDWAAARLFLEQKSPYTEESLATMNLQNYGFGHPPTTSFWFIPFAPVGYPVMAEIVGILTLVALLFHLIICAHELQLPAKTAFVLLGFGLALQTTWLHDHLVLVQVSEIIAFLFALSWYFLRRRRQIEAGVTLGIACTLKLFPGVLVLFLLLTRRFKGFAAACLTYAVVAIYMTTGYGLQAWKDFFRQQGPIANYWIGHIRNASLHGIIVRLFKPLCERPVDDPNVLDIVGALRKLPSMPPIPGARWASVASVILLGFCWWISRRDARRTSAIDVPYALMCTAAVFVNPWIWEHYVVLLITPLFVLIAATVRRGKEIGRLLVDCDRAPRTLPKAVAEVVLLSSAAVAIVALLWVNGYTKMGHYGDYWVLRNANELVPAALHRRMHWYEIFNWLPWVVAIAGLSGLTLFENRRYASQMAAGVTVRIAPTAPPSPNHQTS
jgi:Glycosyltransferase family 87